MTKTLVTRKIHLVASISQYDTFKLTDITPDRSPVVYITLPYNRIYAKSKAA